MLVVYDGEFTSSDVESICSFVKYWAAMITQSILQLLAQQ